MKKKRLIYDDWTVISSKRFKQINIDTDFFKGIVALLYIDEVTNPQTWEFHGYNYLVCDKGMKWLQMILYNGTYVITAMINVNNEIELWYIDMIASYGLDSDNIAYFYDLYLDLVVYSSGEIKVDDLDELEEALNNKHITPDLYHIALETSQKLQCGILKDISHLRELSMSCLNVFD